MRLRVRRLGPGKPINPLAASAVKLLPHSKIGFLGAFAALLMLVVVPILFQIDMPSVAANSTLNCYDSAGNCQPCGAPDGASPSQFNGQTTATYQLAGWTTTALYQQAIWPTTTVDQPANWKTSAADQSADLITRAPAARRSTPGKRSAVCGRRLIPCFFSAVRRGFTHIASVAATVGRAHPAKEHL